MTQSPIEKITPLARRKIFCETRFGKSERGEPAKRTSSWKTPLFEWKHLARTMPTSRDWQRRSGLPKTTFPELDEVLTRIGDRRCIVRSGIGLSVPGRGEPIFFFAETSGIVVDEPRAGEFDPIYPWLDPNSFSAWFVPDGATRTLWEMSFEESLRFDFRAKALLALIDRLEEYALALNTPHGSYWRRTALGISGPTAGGEAALFDIEGRDVKRCIWLVVGPTCAGKQHWA